MNCMLVLASDHSSCSVKGKKQNPKQNMFIATFTFPGFVAFYFDLE